MRVWTLLAFVGMSLVQAGPAWAHALAMTCTSRDGKVHVEAFFDDDTPAVNARVQVLDSLEKVVVEGKTDASGAWACPAPADGHYVVIVDAGAGHRARETMTLPRLLMPPPTGAAVAPETPTVSAGTSREEFTRFPYLRVGLGVGGIFLFSVAFLAARRLAAVRRTALAAVQRGSSNRG